MYRALLWKSPQPAEEREAEIWINPRYVVSLHPYKPSGNAGIPITQITMQNGTAYYLLGLVEQHGPSLRALQYHQNKEPD